MYNKEKREENDRHGCYRKERSKKKEGRKEERPKEKIERKKVE